jgi:hypothetical protein
VQGVVVPKPRLGVCRVANLFLVDVVFVVTVAVFIRTVPFLLVIVLF